VAQAQLVINSSPNPVGSGARALGMGAAFVAIADDATAASWNPGGLTQLERPEFSLVLSHKLYKEDFRSGSHPELDGAHSVDVSDFNYLSFVYPIRRTIAGRNLVLSINYQNKFDFDRELKIGFNSVTGAAGSVINTFSRIDYQQEGQLAALSPAFGIELTDKLSVGIVANIYNQNILPDNGWSVDTDTRGFSLINGTFFPFTSVRTKTRENFDNFEGLNFTFGALYKPNPRWSLGAVYNTKFTADVDYKIVARSFLLGAGPGYSRQQRPMQYVFPSSLAIGAAYRFPNDKLTLSFDITRREWDQFEIYDPRNSSLLQQRRSGVTGQPQLFSPKIDPTYTIRAGMEYVFVDPSKPKQNYLPSIRAGVFYDPEPASGRANTFWGLTRGDGSNDDYFGISLGAGVLIRDRVNIDAAYTYRWGSGVRADSFGLAETDGDIDQHLLYLSTVIYF